MSKPFRDRIQLQPRSFYIEALKQNPRMVALLVITIITVPLFLFTSLPPVEVLEEIPQEVESVIEIPVLVNHTREVKVNRTIQVKVNITEEVVLNRTIGVNITKGASIFLEPQPAPPLIDSDLVLCIDISGSMDASRMPIAQAAIKKMFEVLNLTNFLNLSNDRVALVSFNGSRDSDWTNDAFIESNLDYIRNKTHLTDLITDVENLEGDGWTDAWAGLNKSLDILLNNPRNGSSLKTILFLTDGAHNTGPWGVDVENQNYTGFMRYPANYSSNFTSTREFGPNSRSPIVVARENNVKIYSIGLFEGTSFDFDEDFLTNISLNQEYGTFGDFFVGNDTLSLTESFLKARDLASGWTQVSFVENSVNGNGSQEIFVFNVTNKIRRLKWDINWNDTDKSFNLSIINPNGTIIPISVNSTKGILPVSLESPMSIIIDFPSYGNWSFNMTWSNISSPETIKSRLSSFEPPIFIDSISQINTTDYFAIPQANNPNSKLGILPSIIQTRINGLNENSTLSNQSVLFQVNVTNKNPTFLYHNITPFLLGNFSEHNFTMEWIPSQISELPTGNTTTFVFNLTFNEPAFLQGEIYFKVNCTEGYYDAIAQGVSLDYRINTQNITVETYLTNQTFLITVNQTEVVQVNQTFSTIIISQVESVYLTYFYDTQVFDTVKWTGFLASFAILLSFLGVYVTAQAYRLRKFAKSVRSRLFRDYSALEEALQEKGISVSSEDLSAMIDNTVGLDQFGEKLFSFTGQKLTPEELIRLTSGVSTDQLLNRLSFVTGISPEVISTRLSEAVSIKDLISALNLDDERFLDIITQDEQVVDFQSRVATLIKPKKVIKSNIILNEDLDFQKFRSRMKREFKR